ncbi:hypothetical protein ACSBR1_001645 [Camellia fascicularis]
MKEWKSGLRLHQERCIWIRCYGIPLNFWSVNTLKSIGSVWGKVIQFDGNLGQPLSFSSAKVRIVTKKMEIINEVVNLECKGQLYPVRVCEEQTVTEESVATACKCKVHLEDNEGSNSNSMADLWSHNQRREKMVAKKVDMAADTHDEVDGGNDMDLVNRLNLLVSNAVLENDDRLHVSVVAETKSFLGSGSEGGTCVKNSKLQLVNSDMEAGEVKGG